MQRHPALQPLSRDHHDVLVVARSLNKSVTGSTADRQSALHRFVVLWKDELQHHLDLEDDWLMSHLPSDLRSRMKTDHDYIRELSTVAAEFQNTVRDSALLESALLKFVAELANVLRNHVRWEEREVFETLQKNLTQATLAELSTITTPLDVARRRRLLG